MIKSPQVQKQLPIMKRNIGSVDNVRRQEVNKRLAEIYRANPIRSPINVFENKENGAAAAYVRRPPLPVKYERLIVPNYPVPIYANPVRQAGRAVLERPHYHISPQWWG